MSSVTGAATPPRARSTAGFGVASAVANALGYLTSVVLARGLGPEEFGAIGALLALGIIGTIPYTAVQLTVSRRAADARAAGRHVSRLSAVAVGLVVGAGLCLVFVAAAWPVAAYLKLDHPWQVVGVGLVLVPMLAAAALNGILLGEERLGRLAWSVVTSGLARVLAVLVAVLAGAGVGGVLVALVLGAAVASSVVFLLAPGRGHERLPLLTGAHAMTRGAVVLTAYFLLTNLDVPIARHHLTGADSGTYALASLFAKVCLWGPQFLAVAAFPRMHRAGGRSTALWVLGLTAGFGVGIAAVLVPAAPAVVELVAGRPVSEAASLAPLFALLGTSWAVVNVVVLHDIATRPRRLGGWVWLTTAALVAALTMQPTPTSVGAIVTWALAVSAAGALVGVVRLVRDEHRSVGHPVGPPPVDRTGEAAQSL